MNKLDTEMQKCHPRLVRGSGCPHIAGMTTNFNLEGGVG